MLAGLSKAIEDYDIFIGVLKSENLDKDNLITVISNVASSDYMDLCTT